jgi:hypothetical protein
MLTMENFDHFLKLGSKILMLISLPFAFQMALNVAKSRSPAKVWMLFAIYANTVAFPFFLSVTEPTLGFKVYLLTSIGLALVGLTGGWWWYWRLKKHD